MQSAPGLPRYFEFESFRRSVSRKLWFAVGALFLVAVLSLGLALIAFARPIPVVAFDAEGRPLLFRDTATARMTLTEIRVEYFATEFVRLWVGVDSAAGAEHLAQALNMMTPQLRKLSLADDGALEKHRLARTQNVRTVFSDFKVRIGQFDPADFEGRVHVLVTGKMNYEPRFGKAPTEDLPFATFLTQLVLDRVPVRKNAIHGLLVAYAETRTFASTEDLERYMTERAL